MHEIATRLCVGGTRKEMFAYRADLFFFQFTKKKGRPLAFKRIERERRHGEINKKKVHSDMMFCIVSRNYVNLSQ